MVLRKLLLLIALASVITCCSQEGTYSISFPSNFPAMVKQDVAELLSVASTKKWKITSTENVSTGIVLKLDTLPSFQTAESFHIQSDGTKFLILTSSSLQGLQFGIYKHLRSLGFKFYLPDELYTIIPVVKNPFGPKRNVVDQPFAQIRDFFGTGGFGSGNSDTSRNVEKSWTLWKLRNGFGAAYALAGHRGENFVLENKDVLEKHPEWLAGPLYKNGKLDVSVKLNYLNKDAVDFYTDWTIKPLTKPGFKVPPPNVTTFVSIEPSDGGGYLTNAATKNNAPSVSNQVYGSANVAAAKLDKLFPGHPNIGVNLYAYSSHAEPPTFKLHPRVFVQVVPYQFQNIAFGPLFIKMWAAKAKRFGIYDYYKYPDAQYDLPGGALQEMMLRLFYSIKNGSEGTIFETSYSKFATGVPLWLMGRYLADGDTSWNQNLNILTADLYQTARSPIKNLFMAFYDTPIFTVNDMNKSLAFLDKASNATRDRIVTQRLSELKAYLYFVHLVFQSRNVSNGSLKERLLPVSEYAWKIYNSKIIDSYRIMALVSYSFLNADKSIPDYASYHQLHLDWFPETKFKAAAWAKIPQQINADVMEKNFLLLKQTYAKQPGSASTYTLDAVFKTIKPNYLPIDKFVVGGNNLARGYFSVYSPVSTSVHIRYRLFGSSTAPQVNLSGIDKLYTSPVLYTLSKPEGEITFTIPAGETNFFMHASLNTTYRLEIRLDDGVFFFNGLPKTVMAFYKSLSDSMNKYTIDPEYFPTYIFFPEPSTIINYRTLTNKLVLTPSINSKTESKLLQKEISGFELRQLNIASQTAGTWWHVTGDDKYQFLNIPDRYFLIKPK